MGILHRKVMINRDCRTFKVANMTQLSSED